MDWLYQTGRQRSCFVGLVADVNVLTKMIGTAPASTNNNIERIVVICEKLPETFFSTAQKSNVENSEEYSKESTLRNIHRKVHQSLKKTGASFYDAMEINNEKGGVFGKKNFDLFFLDYSSDNYVEASELERPKNEGDTAPGENITVVFEYPHNKRTGTATVPEKALIDFSASTLTYDPISISLEPAAEESKRVETSPECTQATEAEGRLAKLENLSNRMKKEAVTSLSTTTAIRFKCPGLLIFNLGLLKPATKPTSSMISQIVADNGLAVHHGPVDSRGLKMREAQYPIHTKSSDPDTNYTSKGEKMAASALQMNPRGHYTLFSEATILPSISTVMPSQPSGRLTTSSLSSMRLSISDIGFRHLTSNFRGTMEK